MPVTLEWMTPRLYRSIYNVAIACDPYEGRDDHGTIIGKIAQMEGWAVRHDDAVVGFVLWSDFVPYSDIILHVSILPQYRGKWVTRGMLREFFSFPFCSLELHRVSSFYVPGLSDIGGHGLARLGFRDEGRKRDGIKVNGKYHDVIWMGMLKSECRWL